MEKFLKATAQKRHRGLEQTRHKRYICRHFHGVPFILSLSTDKKYNIRRIEPGEYDRGRDVDDAMRFPEKGGYLCLLFFHLTCK
jgi:hypothetical protein